MAVEDQAGGDDSWDPVWDVATSVDSAGWVAEIAIPFSQLRFSRAREQVWGIQLFRHLFRRNEQAHFAPRRRTESGFTSRFGHLTGLTNIPAPKRIELLPYSVGRGAYDQTATPGDPFNDGSSYFGGGGLDLKYGLSSNLTLDASINPDFGQVEIDPAFVNLTAFEQFLPERRPFFVEGASIFAFGGGAGGGPQFGGALLAAHRAAAPGVRVGAARRVRRHTRQRHHLRSREDHRQDRRRLVGRRDRRGDCG